MYWRGGAVSLGLGGCGMGGVGLDLTIVRSGLEIAYIYFARIKG
jgi:hypothetical protein